MIELMHYLNYLIQLLMLHLNYLYLVDELSEY